MKKRNRNRPRLSRKYRPAFIFFQPVRPPSWLYVSLLVVLFTLRAGIWPVLLLVLYDLYAVRAS